jgi:hypothetical protein
MYVQCSRCCDIENEIPNARRELERTLQRATISHGHLYGAAWREARIYHVTTRR